MPKTKISDVNQKLEILRQRFRTKAAVELAHVQARASGIAAGSFMAADVLSVYQSLHRLAGSAGTFGFPELGKLARQLEIALKPLAEALATDPDGTVRAEPIARVVNAEFLREVDRLVQWLSEEGDRDDASAVTTEPGRAPVARAAEPVVLVVAPSSDVSRDLCQGLSLHGFQPRLVDQLEALDPAVLAREVSAVVLYDWELEAELPFLALGNDRPPVVCLGEEDTFLERYVLAEKGMDGFFTLPLDLPLLVDFIERLISERDELDRGRVMIVDDDPELLEHYSLVLEEVGLVVCRVNDPSTLLTSLSEFRPNLVLMDMQMGRYSGATLARMIRFDPEWLGLPIVYLSSEENRERQLEALSHGGDDFLTKPVSDHYLQRAVLVRCYRARQLEKLATRDSLTGLLKHSLANAEIENEFARSVRAGQESVVAMLDLDHFKRVNDRYGHRAGDMVIKGLANLLRHRLRKSDILGRYGGEEFIVALVDCALDDARAVMASVCERLSRIVFNAGDQEFSVTVSIGLARMNDYPTVEAAIEAADKALYERKHSGRNGVSLAPDSNLGRTG
ncbi:hypothetical protein BTO32_13070 [Marinobacter lutaoensis]|uniref:diguanylate cyclase n=1 Tax=Marinobacter lutaoensis TaxID=135739 RepID=A0A1V2DS85_9GAMM|nr:diguanylate cyclase [Marinobacter lutaoensis]ONF43584.1 hypothetical protein BTO32_13070 [Marinobacter lutaoensis]